MARRSPASPASPAPTSSPADASDLDLALVQVLAQVWPLLNSLQQAVLLRELPRSAWDPRESLDLLLAGSPSRLRALRQLRAVGLVRVIGQVSGRDGGSAANLYALADLADPAALERVLHQLKHLKFDRWGFGLGSDGQPLPLPDSDPHPAPVTLYEVWPRLTEPQRRLLNALRRSPVQAAARDAFLAALAERASEAGLESDEVAVAYTCLCGLGLVHTSAGRPWDASACLDPTALSHALAVLNGRADVPTPEPDPTLVPRDSRRAVVQARVDAARQAPTAAERRRQVVELVTRLWAGVGARLRTLTGEQHAVAAGTLLQDCYGRMPDDLMEAALTLMDLRGDTPEDLERWVAAARKGVTGDPATNPGLPYYLFAIIAAGH